LPIALLPTLGAVTLVLQAVTLWYLPSFAKRALAWRPLARASPWLLAGGCAASGWWLAFPSNLFADLTAALCAAGLLAWSASLLASLVVGERWRGGVPFWRAEGPHRAGDRLAAALLLPGLAAALLSGVAGLWLVGASMTLDAPGQAVLLGVAVWGWVASLALLAAGALVHLVPRGRGQPLHVALAYPGAALLALGVLLAPVAFGAPLRTGLASAPRALLAAGLVLLVLGMRGEIPPDKKPGPRMRQARAHLAAALVAGLLGATGLLAVVDAGGLDLALGIALSTTLAVGALSVLALPVVFNQRPAPAFLLPAAVAPILGALLARVSLDRFPEEGGSAMRLGAALALATGLLLWLAALWPLRKPRRACPPGEEPT